MPLLFSYGTLQQDDVQVATFGRRLAGGADELLEYDASTVAIEDPAVAARIGRTHHDNATFVGGDDRRLPGTAFEVSDAELASADEYEAPYGYTRVMARLASGRSAWVYVHASGGVTPGEPG